MRLRSTVFDEILCTDIRRVYVQFPISPREKKTWRTIDVLRNLTRLILESSEKRGSKNCRDQDKIILSWLFYLYYWFRAIQRTTNSIKLQLQNLCIQNPQKIDRGHARFNGNSFRQSLRSRNRQNGDRYLIASQKFRQSHG